MPNRDIKNSLLLVFGTLLPSIFAVIIFSQLIDNHADQRLNLYILLILINTFLSTFDGGIIRCVAKLAYTKSIFNIVTFTLPVLVLYSIFSLTFVFLYLAYKDISDVTLETMLLWVLSFICSHMVKGISEATKNFQFSSAMQVINGFVSIIVIVLSLLQESEIDQTILTLAVFRLAISLSVGFFSSKRLDQMERHPVEVTGKEQLAFFSSAAIGISILFADRVIIETFSSLQVINIHIIAMEVIGRASIISSSYAAVQYQNFLSDPEHNLFTINHKAYGSVILGVLIINWLLYEYNFYIVYIIYGTASVVVLSLSLILLAKVQANGDSYKVSQVHFGELLTYIPLLALAAYLENFFLYLTIWFLRLAIEVFLFSYILAQK